MTSPQKLALYKIPKGMKLVPITPENPKGFEIVPVSGVKDMSLECTRPDNVYRKQVKTIISIATLCLVGIWTVIFLHFYTQPLRSNS